MTLAAVTMETGTTYGQHEWTLISETTRINFTFIIKWGNSRDWLQLALEIFSDGRGKYAT